MKKFLVISIFLAIRVNAIEPVVISIGPSYPISYTVPTNKVLLIETVSSSVDYVNMDITIGNKHNPIQIQAKTVNFARPMKIPSGATISRLYVDGVYANLVIFGLLVDLEDLYARIDSHSDNLMLDGDNFSFDVTVADARPCVLTVSGRDSLTSGAWGSADAIIQKSGARQYAVNTSRGSFIKTDVMSVAQ